MCLSAVLDAGVSAVCCAGSAVCSGLCCCCQQICGTTMKQQVRLSYVFLTTFCVLFSTIVLYWVQDLFSSFTSYVHCQGSNNLDCLGISAIYRMSFTLAIFYSVILFFLLFRNEFSKSINEGWWCLKIMVILGGFFAFFFVDNNFFIDYTNFARYFGAGFLIIQSIMLIDLFYMWGENWVRQYDNGIEYMKYVLIFTALALYAGMITLNVYNFSWFASSSQCGMNIFVNILNVGLIVLLTTIQLMGYNPNGSLICSGAESLYMTFLTFSAQLSGPKSECNAMFDNVISSGGVMALEISFAIFLLVVVLLYLSFGSKEESPNKLQVGADTNLNAAVLPSQEDEDAGEQHEDLEQPHSEEKQPLQSNKGSTNSLKDASGAKQGSQAVPPGLKNYLNNQYFMFHFIMLVASVYICMLLTNWRKPSMNENIMDVFKPSEASYWVQLIISWSSAGLYIWTLIAPALFPDRDFGPK